MKWKYFFPDPWKVPTTRVPLEEVTLIPPQARSGATSYLFTLEGLHSFTGGTIDEKLERLGNGEYSINDMMDMLIRRDDFDKAEFLEWTLLFIRLQFGDPDPVLVETTEDERATWLAELHALDARQGPCRLLFVHAPGDPTQLQPEAILARDPRMEVRTTALEDAPIGPADGDLFDWAEIIVVMGKRMRHVLRRRLRDSALTKRVVCLHLPEHHSVEDPAFLALFRERIDVYLQKLVPERNQQTSR
jgi:predicted protein tyrosine phosphatase